MLILKRAPKESLFIGVDAAIEVAILSIENQCVRVGIKAPKDIPIYRKELFIEEQYE